MSDMAIYQQLANGFVATFHAVAKEAEWIRYLT
jgi:hypothetical protein